jgi:hypothetical protein
VRTSWAKAICGFSSAISWIANDGSRWPSQDIVATLLRKEKGENPVEVEAKKKMEAAAGGSQVVGQSLNATTPTGDSRFGAEDEDELNTTSVFDSERPIDETSILTCCMQPKL